MRVKFWDRGPELSKYSFIPKNKDTLFLPTLKVEENKVSFIHFIHWVMDNFLILQYLSNGSSLSQNGHISAWMAQIQNRNTLYFYLHLLSSSWRSCCGNVVVLLVPTYLKHSFRAPKSIEEHGFELYSEKQSLRTQWEEHAQIGACIHALGNIFIYTSITTNLDHN